MMCKKRQSGLLNAGGTKMLLAAMLAAGAAVAASHASYGSVTTLITDNFNTSATGSNINTDLSTRQTGTLAPADYSATNGSTLATITNNALSTPVNSGLVLGANLTSALTAPATTGFTVSFQAANKSTAANLAQWISPYLSTQTSTNGDRGVSEFGLIIFGTGTVGAYGGNGVKQTTTYASEAQITAAIGQTFNVATLNSYSLVATPDSATAGSYDVFINGTDVISNVAYTLNPSDTIEWHNRNDLNGLGLYDNLSVSLAATPEPAALGLLGIGGLGLLLARRRRA